MRLCITLDHRFERTPDGAIWTQSGSVYRELRQYLQGFEEVRILARVRAVATASQPAERADGPGIAFWPLPYYLGFGEFCRRWRSVQRAALAGFDRESAILLRAPSTISCLVEPALRKVGRPFAVQLCGDPRDLFARGAIRHPLRPWIRRWFTRRTAAQCRAACAVWYVTAQTLQARYPANPNALQVAASDVVLPARWFALAPRSGAVHNPLRLITVGSLEHPYKGTDVLIRALSKCVKEGLDARLIVVGDGRYRAALVKLAARLRLINRVDFVGAVPAGEKVIAQLDSGDIFVLPSRTEGLPRAMVEAMARALPCIGAKVGGIPELLDAEDLVPPGNSEALARTILQVAGSGEQLRRMSERSLLRAQDFRESQLQTRRSQFFEYVREAVERRITDVRPEKERSIAWLG